MWHLKNASNSHCWTKESECSITEPFHHLHKMIWEHKYAEIGHVCQQGEFSGFIRAIFPPRSWNSNHASNPRVYRVSETVFSKVSPLVYYNSPCIHKYRKQRKKGKYSQLKLWGQSQFGTIWVANMYPYMLIYWTGTVYSAKNPMDETSFHSGSIPIFSIKEWSLTYVRTVHCVYTSPNVSIVYISKYSTYMYSI